MAAREGSTLLEVNELLLRRVAELEHRLERAEQENRDFAQMCVRVQEENDALNGLYVASYRLHETLDAQAVLKAISEILIDLVGAEEFALLLFDERHHVFERLAWEGPGDHLPPPVVPADDPLFRELATCEEPVYFAPPGEAAGAPVAALPLRLHGEAVGLIAIYRLLRQKHGGFSDADRQVLQLLAAHAATALVSSRLYGLTDRKLRTIEGFMRLLTGTASDGRQARRGATT